MAQGTSGNDTLSNSSAGASLDALSGNDVIDNWSERSTIRGGAGNDSIYNHTDASNSLLDAGAGNDRINNWAVRSTLIGDSGNDILYNDPSASSSVIDAGAGNDTIYSWADGTTINTGTGNDTIENHASSSVITLGGDGNTIRTYNDAKFSIHGSAQGSELRFDIQDGSTVDATINFGGSGNDTFYATDNPELLILESGAGDNDVYNYGGEDTISIAGTLSEAYGMTYEDVRIYGNNISGSINIKNGVGKTLTIVDDNGVHRKKFSDYITSPQDVIKTFMSALDQTTLQGSAALDEAVKACSSFGSAQALINQIVSDCANAGDAETFLRDYCGIIIDNQDTGAITGWDAGGSTVKTAESIVPESGSLNTFTGTSFVKNGLTLTVPSQSSMTNNQKQIINGFYTWWAQKGLDLVKESYGSNYGFDSDSSASVKNIALEFVNETSGLLARVIHSWNGSKTTSMTLQINVQNYGTLSDTINGATTVAGASYLDRTIAHELTHAVMSANIDYFHKLPLYITEGMAELTHGIDDARTNDIKTLAGNSSKLSQVFDTYDYATVSGVGNPTYAGGYILLRYLAKQAALDSGVTYNATSGNNNTSSGMSKMLLNLGAGNDTLNVSGQNVTIDGGAGNDVVSLSAHQNVIRLGIGGGNDTVYGFGSSDSIQMYGGTSYNAEAIGDDLLFSAYDGTILFKGGASLAFDNFAPNVTIDGGIYNYNNNSVVGGTSGADFIYSNGSPVTINAGNGNDTVLSSWRSSLTAVNGGNGNDLIFLQSGYETADGGGGNDTIYSNLAYNRTNRVYKFNASGGADVVIGYQSTDTINITDGSSYSTQLSGADMIVSIGSARMTLKDASGKMLNVNGGSLVSSVNTINNSSSNKKVSGTSSAEWIVNSGSNVTIQGNKGNDTIVGSSNAELILVASDHGNDLIQNFGANDTLRCTAGSINSTAKSGSNVIVTLKGSAYQSVVTLGGAASLNLKKSGQNLFVGSSVNTIDNRTRNTIVSGSSGADSIYNYARNVTINAGSGNDTVETYGNSVKVEGGDGNDSIKTTGGTGVTLHGGNGNDTLTGSSGSEVFQYRSDGGADVITNFGTNDTLHIAAGKLNSYYSSGSDLIVHAKGTSYQGYVTLKGAASQAVKVKVGTGAVQTINSGIVNNSNNVKVSGTSSAERIVNNGSGVTIQGNAGADTIVGSNYGELILVASNHGNDLIQNFGSNDTLRCTAGSINSFATVGSDVVVTLKGSAYSSVVTLGGAASLNLQKNGSYIYGSTVNMIDNRTRNTIVTGTSANDSIYNYAREVTINAGAGNDTVETYGNYVSVLGGDGNDSLRSTGGSGVTLHGGKGNDTLTGSSGSEVYQFRSDGGNDVVTNFGINDTLKITAGSIQSYYASGSDYIVNAKGTSYSGTITLKNAVDIGTLTKSGNTIRLNASSAQLPSEEYWFEQIDQNDQAFDEINSILSIENNEITFEIDPIDRIKASSIEIVGERPLKVRAFTSKKD